MYRTGGRGSAGTSEFATDEDFSFAFIGVQSVPHRRLKSIFITALCRSNTAHARILHPDKSPA
jgi:hypothetical protein